MAVSLVIAPEAGEDVVEGYSWYEEKRVGLGEEFLSSVDASMEAIRRFPEMCPVVHESYRRGLVRRFPYAVYYEQVGDVVTVYSVFHTAQDPQKWRQRIP
jgi:plasmid stabilization system protein ParE